MDVAFISQFSGGRRVFRYVEASIESQPVKERGGDPLEESYCQRVVDGRLPELIHDAASLPAALELPVTKALPVGAHMSVPIRLADGSVYGTFCCFSFKPDHSLNERDLAVMQVFAELSADYIEKDLAESNRRGVARHLEPLTVDPSLEVDSLFDAFAFDRRHAYHAKIHQIRVITTADIHGVAVVEGPHRDGHEWQIVAVFRRHNIVGGESQLLPTGGGTPFFAQVLGEGEALCNADAAMWHNATDIFPKDAAAMGYRDIWIIATNVWERRRYGERFEAASLEDGKARWDVARPVESAQVTPLH